MKLGIAMEGGAIRCSFSTGIVQALAENGIVADSVCGTSAGACCAFGYQADRYDKILEVLTLDSNKSYYGIKELLRSFHYVNLEKMMHILTNGVDMQSFFQASIQSDFTATCLETGKAAYLSYHNNDEKQLFQSIIASSALPVVCDAVEVDGLHYVDGSIADPIPFQHLLNQGCDKVIVILTGSPKARPTDYSKFKFIMKPVYAKKYPQFYHAIMNRVQIYYDFIANMKEREKEGKVLVFRPQILPIGLFEKNREKILDYYQHGKDLVNQEIDQIKQWLEI